MREQERTGARLGLGRDTQRRSRNPSNCQCAHARKFHTTIILYVYQSGTVRVCVVPDASRVSMIQYARRIQMRSVCFHSRYKKEKDSIRRENNPQRNINEGPSRQANYRIPTHHALLLVPLCISPLLSPELTWEGCPINQTQQNRSV